jgi:uncharacterized protein (UPF0335 family)
MSTNAEPDSIILRYLRKLDERTERIEENQKDMAADIRILKGHMAGFMQAETRQDGAMASMSERIDRIEKRLEISDR